MKLILANNQTEKFVEFYKELQNDSEVPFDYSGYIDLLFIFDSKKSNTLELINTSTNRSIREYDGVYINGFLNTYELAASVAICCDALEVPYQNKEMGNPVSMSKLTMFSKLAAAKVNLPWTVAGSSKALRYAIDRSMVNDFPKVLKRADADRGIDNFKVKNGEEIINILDKGSENDIWLLQDYIENDGYYLVTYYDSKPAFSIFRSLEIRPDGDEQKAHMYKPKGGANAKQILLEDIPPSILRECTNAITAMNRQIGSVDCIYDKTTEETYILEVNYNPQLVTIETLKELRKNTFAKNIKNIK